MLAVRFGSSCRGDANYSSDKDVLIVGGKWSDIAPLKNKYESRGCSVSAFRMERAEFLSANGNLFFKHIFDEGVLESGDKNEFARLSSRWAESSDYMEEARQNVDLLDVLRWVPLTHGGVLAAIDILVSSARNILIRRLASSGCYVFSWASIFHQAKLRGMIKPHDIPILLKARIIKNQYRQGVIPLISREYLSALIESAGRACGQRVNFRFGSIRELDALPRKIKDGSYKQLRAIELLAAQYPLEPEFIQLRYFISDPSYFCAHGPNHSLQARRP